MSSTVSGLTNLPFVRYNEGMKERPEIKPDPGFSDRFNRIATIVLIVVAVIGGFWILSVPWFPS